MTELTPQQRRVIYRARRGLKELDVYIDPYVKNYYASESPEQQATFAILVEQEDPDLLDWFMGTSEPQDAALKDLIERIKTLCQPTVD